MIRIESKWDSVLDDIDRITKRMPTPAMIARLDAVLGLALSEVQATTHVETGSLKASGKKSSKTSKARKRWTGTLSMGGPSSGVNSVVDYAIYERERDGSHDFFHTLPLLHPFFMRAIKAGLGDG